MSLNRLQNVSVGSGAPLLCLEVNPPRGVDHQEIFSKLESLPSELNFFNVTDSALARMRMSPFAFAALLKQRFNLEPLVNLSCRDRNLIAVQAEILGAWASGVRSVVALTGDAVSIGDDPERKGVFETNSIGLLNTIKTLNSGLDLAGNKLKGAPQVLPGVVVNPNATNTAAEIRRLAKKRDAGARYALSQPVFDKEASQRFLQEASQVGVPIFLGLLPFKNSKAAQYVTTIPGIKLSAEFSAVIQSHPDKDLSQFSIEHCVALARLNRQYVAGFHIISGASTRLALQLAQELARCIRDKSV